MNIVITLSGAGGELDRRVVPLNPGAVAAMGGVGELTTYEVIEFLRDTILAPGDTITITEEA
jgi:hypothetical protein